MRVTDPKSTYEYITKADQALDPAEQTVFLLRPLTARQAAEIEDHLVELRDAQTTGVRTGTQTLTALRHGLRGWRNLLGEQLQPLPFVAGPGGEPTEEMLDLLPPVVRKELAAQILKTASLTDDQVKA